MKSLTRRPNIDQLWLSPCRRVRILYGALQESKAVTPSQIAEQKDLFSGLVDSTDSEAFSCSPL